jgi:hypothetical protein
MVYIDVLQPGTSFLTALSTYFTPDYKRSECIRSPAYTYDGNNYEKQNRENEIEHECK